jgi:putative sterol carrier protein
MQVPRLQNRFARFFFMHLGTLVSILVYFNLAERGGWTVDGLRHALVVALIVKTSYMALAWWSAELKHFDVSVWLLFLIGLVAVALGVEPVVGLYQRYSPALVFVALAFAAAVPPLLGWEPFTYYFARRQVPAWQWKTPAFVPINRLLSGWWAFVFLVAAALCVVRPTDPMFTVVWPNLFVIVVGVAGNAIVPMLYMRFADMGLPTSAEPIIMGMPFMFDKRAAGDVAATIQFKVTDSGDYWLHIARGRCKSFEGAAPSPDLTIRTPDAVWTRIRRGELDGGQALKEGLYTIEGDFALLPKLSEWFRVGRG